MTRTKLLALVGVLALAGRAAAQADDTPRSGAAELGRAFRKKLEYFEQIRKENRERMEKLEQDIEKLDKELVGFQTGAEYEEKLRGTAFERYAKERRLLTNAVLANPEQVKTAVETGRAQNVLLVAMGDWVRKMRFDHAKADPKYNNFRKMSSDLMTISAADVRDNLIPIRTNTSGEKLTLAVGADHPLKFALLPTLLRREPFEPLMKKLEETGDQALEDLRNGKPVSPETERDMLEAMELVVGEYRKFVRDSNKNRATNDLAAALRSQAFVTNLKGTVRIFTEASRVTEVQAPPFAGGTMDDLMVYMTKNNLRFGPCTVQRQREFQMKLFQAMRLYFYDLAAMDRIRQAKKEELAWIDNEQRKITEFLYSGEMERSLERALQHEATAETMRAIQDALRLGVPIQVPNN